MTLSIPQLTGRSPSTQAVRGPGGEWILWPAKRCTGLARTDIEWTDCSFNPIRAINLEDGRVGWHCVPVHGGCANCYAGGQNVRFGTGLEFAAQNTNRVKTVLDEQRIKAALCWKIPKKFVSRAGAGKPPMVFPCDMTDLFGPFVPNEMIDRMMAVIALRPDLIFQALTKRPGRAAEYMNERDIRGSKYGPGGVGRRIHGAARDMSGEMKAACVSRSISLDPYGTLKTWPLPNLWLLTSVSDQKSADDLIPSLLRCPAAVRGVSYEPVLGPVDFRPFFATGAIRWLIVGCESIGRRVGRFADGYEDAAHSAIQQALAAGIHVFHKQMPIDGRVGKDPSEWPEDLRVREWPNEATEASP